jgi:hypothetical protein
MDFELKFYLKDYIKENQNLIQNNEIEFNNHSELDNFVHSILIFIPDYLNRNWFF